MDSFVKRRAPFTIVLEQGEIKGFTADELALVEQVLRFAKVNYSVSACFRTYENGVRKNTN